MSRDTQEQTQMKLLLVSPTWHLYTQAEQAIIAWVLGTTVAAAVQWRTQFLKESESACRN